ncbi:hypothetical protein [Halorientalis pallida]|uniref:Uncharacterized protein n=1 Tax=Halorientalis pallida TaxID=2479928 RepID=A0A498KUH2_9EURY|nr:hypothetical protein [Halorientalis pallida]RXK48530.1 hypothetical protein EAF64_12685 [Halorientalis pallida]
MGLFDWFGGLFGERGPADGRRDGTRQRHGSHWDSVLASGDRETALQTVLLATVEDGTASAAGTHGDGAIVGYRDAPDPVGATVVTLDEQVTTGYPVADGVEHAFGVTDRTEWTSGIEAWVEGTVGPVTVTCFDTDYFAHRSAPPEGEVTASLSVMLYSLQAADPASPLVTEDGAVADTTAGFLPFEEGGADDYAVWTTVGDVTRWTWRDTSGYRLQAPLFRAEGNDDVSVAMYVADHNLVDGYVPEPGDEVEGLGWVQGSFQ